MKTKINFKTAFFIVLAILIIVILIFAYFQVDKYYKAICLNQTAIAYNQGRIDLIINVQQQLINNGFANFPFIIQEGNETKFQTIKIGVIK